MDIWVEHILDFIKERKERLKQVEGYVTSDQRSLHDQLKDLSEIARAIKMEDARDYLNMIVNKGK